MVLFWRTSNTSDPKHNDKLPCPGCGGPLEKDAVSGRYLCDDCDHEWEKGGKFWTASFESLPKNCLSYDRP